LIQSAGIPISTSKNLNFRARSPYPSSEDEKTKQKTENDRIIFNTVLRLREQRNGMVQSKDQYRFVYATVTNLLASRWELSGKLSNVDETTWDAPSTSFNDFLELKHLHQMTIMVPEKNRAHEKNKRREQFTHNLK